MADVRLAKLALLLFGALLSSGCFVMLSLMIGAIRSRRRLERSAMPVTAVVLSHRLIEGCEFDGGAPVYEPKIEYEYEFNGQTFCSSNVWPGPNDSYYVRRPEADQILAQFPVETTVRAFCDPLEPKHAFLLREPPAPSAFVGHVLLFGCVIILVILFSIAYSAGFLLELLAAHAPVLIAGGLWFMWAVQGERRE